MGNLTDTQPGRPGLPHSLLGEVMVLNPGGIVGWAVSCPNVPLSSSPHESHSPPSPCCNTAETPDASVNRPYRGRPGTSRMRDGY